MHILSLTYVEQTIRALIFFPQTGPKDNTVSEFWCMVWQEDIDQIIMLTNLREGRKVKEKILKKYIEFFLEGLCQCYLLFTFQLKCDQYWPDLNATMTCDNVVLTTIKERHYAYYVVRKTKLTHKKVSVTTLISQDLSFFYI